MPAYTYSTERRTLVFTFFFFNDTATTEIYTLSLHDALPILAPGRRALHRGAGVCQRAARHPRAAPAVEQRRSEEHTSELQSPCNLVCRLLLEKKKDRRIDELPPMHTLCNSNYVAHVSRTTVE